MRWAGYVERTGRRGIHIGYCGKAQKERDHQEDQDIDGWIILKWISDLFGWYGLDCSGLGQGPVEGSCEHGIMNFRVP
jgi:hypothetical protein